MAAPPDLAAALGLGALAGLRACEVAALDWSAVDLDGRTLHVLDGKGGHGRQVPIGRLLVDLLAQLPHRRGPVIRRGDGKAGHNRAHRISQRTNKRLRQHGVTFHQLRHRYLTTAYRGSQDLRATQQLAGHASPATTAVYARPASRAVAKAARAAGRLVA